MENLIDMFHTVSLSPWRDKYLNSFLCGCSEHQVFICNNNSRLNQIAADINSKLNNASSRIEGLLFLKVFLSQCPDEIFSQNAFSWASQAFNATEWKMSENNTNKTINHLPLAVLLQIIELSSQFPSVVKQLIPLVSKLLRQLSGYEVKVILADTQYSCMILQCLQACMKHYSTSCVTYKGEIEKLLLSLLFCTNESVIQEASKCFMMLSNINSNVGVKVQLIGGGNGYSTFLWNQMLSKIVNTMQFALNELYENASTFKASSVAGDKFPVPSVVEENPVLAIQSSATLYINLCHYLTSMLTEPLPAAKSIALEEVLGVVCQALAVTCSSLKDRVSAESLALLVCIPQVHIASFSIISSLMACCRFSLLSYGPLIIKLIMQSLKWTGPAKDWPSGVRKPYSSLRCTAYSCMSLWLKISASASCAEEVAEELIGIALNDIVPSREKVTLMTADSRKKSHGKRHKQQKIDGAESATAEISSNSTHGYRCAVGNGSANSDICCAALEVLTYLLYSVGPFIKPNHHKVIQEKTVSVLVDLQRNSSSLISKSVAGKCDATDLILPYQCIAKCRLSLYKLLLSLVMEPHSHKWPPPLGIAAKLFETGFNDPNIEISTFCLTSKRSVERILHPCAPTLNIPFTITGGNNKQPAFLNALIDRVRSRESSAQENSIEEEENILLGRRDVRESLQEMRKVTESAETRQSSTSYSTPSSSEVIATSDKPSMSIDGSKFPYEICAIEIQHCATSNASSNDRVMLRRVHLQEAIPSLQGLQLGNIPLTTIQSIGVQASLEPVPNNSGSSKPSIVDSQPEVLVLKLPIGKSSEVSRKDFTHQYRADQGSMEVDDEVLVVESQSENLEGNIVSNDLASQKSDHANGCDMISSGECDFLSVENSYGLENIANEEKSCQVEVLYMPVGPGVRGKPVAETKTIVEVDIADLSESDEMMSCFVDVEPDSE